MSRLGGRFSILVSAALLFAALLGPAPAGAAPDDAANAAAHDHSSHSHDRASEVACGRLLQRAHPSGNGVTCTHGPDPVPEGLETYNIDSTSDIQAQSQESVAAGTSVPCVGDGHSGNRVQAVYGYYTDNPDRYDLTKASIQGWAVTQVEQVVADSAARTTGTRGVRWVTEAAPEGGCQVSVLKLPMSPNDHFGNASFDAMVDDIVAMGWDRPDRKYLVWVDTDDGADDKGICGVGHLYADDSAGALNYNNGRPETPAMVARVDQSCWNGATTEDDPSAVTPVEAHELLHTMGAVQGTSPQGNFFGHCNDNYDVMCYADGSGQTMTFPCASSSDERLLDCGNDDYFHTSPASGSYLGMHWNTANSSFLTGSRGMCDNTPTSGSDLIQGGSVDQALCGAEGDDTFRVGDAATYLFDGGPGIDTLDLSTLPGPEFVDLSEGEAYIGSSWVFFRSIENIVGTSTYDFLTGNAAVNRIDGAGGNDSVEGGAGDDTLIGGDGVDRIWGGDGVDGLSGGAGKDDLYGDAGDDSVAGGGGLDTFGYWTFSGLDPVKVDLTAGTATGDGSDTLSSIEQVEGTPNADVLKGSSGANYLYGSGGNDSVYGAGGTDNVWAGAGRDVVYGGGGGDFLRGEGGNDKLYGEAGLKDWLNGGSGTDLCKVGGTLYYLTQDCEKGDVY